MDDLILKRISGLISQHSGIHIRDQDYSSLAEKVWRRANSLHLTSLADYHTYLLNELENGKGSLVGSTVGAVSTSEWQELYSILTINESYFFRDSNQFRLLTERILPDIISRKQAAAGPGAKPSLRIWSAGCSTGEELYSIAIALDELNFPWDHWDTLLIGTDISKAAVDGACLGLYGNWSFRQMPANLQQKYFHSHRQIHQICDRLRQRVTFQCGNLLSDPCPHPASSLCNIDLIFCRNVFIYLDSQAIGQIIQKFHRALVLQGYLFTGHTELYSQDTSRFKTLSFSESIVYQKQPESRLAPPQPVQAATIPALEPQRAIAALKAKSLAQTTPRPEAGVTHQTQVDLEKALRQAETLLEQEAYTSAICRAEAIFKAHPRCDAARKIAARAYANTGRHEQAKHLCLQVIRRHPLSVEMHYLLAQIAEDQNDLDGAKVHLRKIIYLDASFVKAYLDLASIYEREKQPDKTQKMRSHALMLLAKLPPEARLDHYSDTTVAQWQHHLTSKIGNSET
ncbi:tetratricopeptide repeat protein [Nodosilinea sp. LEGE 06152]|uniref:CheR family methyltransferase n=1 Tax=Nodosilinea sp. LEGE 06152 TaxID=2777966 RepID=UPI00188299F5|nr:protein-glutamate O-methyltransferase CheR [Nodosilinea sp. LEGE 06152]MBE9156118.1 tetratricopeptide repeat protein [Nodosilinea sp. LEGE 06152]